MPPDLTVACAVETSVPAERTDDRLAIFISLVSSLT